MLSDLLMWNKIGRIVTLLAERLDVSGERALDIFYTSRTNERLHDEHTGLYLMSDRYLVDEVIRELKERTDAPDTYMLMSEGVADMHCRSDEYLADELMLELKEKPAPGGSQEGARAVGRGKDPEPKVMN